MLIDQYPKISNTDTEKPEENSVVLFQRPNSSNQNEPLVVGRVLEVTLKNMILSIILLTLCIQKEF